MKRTVDLRSDTVTKPTPGMRGAMMDTEVGDDVFGENPIVNALQEKVAKLSNKEATLFVCLENTHNRAGGRVYPIEKIREIHSLAKRYGLAMHLDGARLMNASVAMGIPPDS